MAATCVHSKHWIKEYQRPFKISLDVHGKNHWYSRYCIIQTPFCCVLLFSVPISLSNIAWYQNILNIIQTHISLWYSVGFSPSASELFSTTCENTTALRLGSRSSDVCPGVLRRHERTGAEVLRKARLAGVLFEVGWVFLCHISSLKITYIKYTGTYPQIIS